MSVSGQGELVQGVDDVNQCLNIILTTQQGTDPLRPDFGVDLLSWIDKPQTIVAAGLVPAIIRSIADYEPRIDLRRVNYTAAINGQLMFGIAWTFKDDLLYIGGATERQTYTTYFLLSDQNGFILLDDYNVSIMVK